MKNARGPRYTEASERLGRSRRIKPCAMYKCDRIGLVRPEIETRPVNPKDGRQCNKPHMLGQEQTGTLSVVFDLLPGCFYRDAFALVVDVARSSASASGNIVSAYFV